MSVTICKGRGIYVVQEGNEFEIHVKLNREILDQADALKRILNEQLTWSGTGIHACMVRHGNKLHFQSSSFTSWNKDEADKVLANIWDSLTLFETNLILKKRKRQVRDAFNKCNDLRKIERIATILLE
jgi:hypothetical protein